MRTMRSNFYRLMGGLGGSEKATGGGSFGFGKAAAILNSQLFTIFAYTITEEADGRSKLWGTSYLDPHKLGRNDYLGVGWFCREESEDADPLILEDIEADAIANRLAIHRVQSRETGTTLALIYPSTGMAGLEMHVRENWWPRIAERANDASHQLIYVREDGRRKPISLEGDKRIKPFIGLYDVARGLKQPTPELRRYELSFNCATGNVRLGVLALSLDPDAAQGDDALDGVALVRKPKMVVTYYRPRGFPLGMRGVFVADPGMDSFLRKTEPHEHDDWNEKISGPSLDKERQYAKLIKSEIRKRVREFMDTYTPPPEAEPKLLPELRRLLGNLFSTSGVGSPPPGGDPVSITHKLTRIEQVGTRLKLVGSAHFTSLAKEANAFNLGVEVKIVESDLGSGGDPLSTTICVAGKTSGPDDRPSHKLTLDPGETIEVEFETETYESEWTAKAIFWSERVEQ
ncbi:MAG: hypothetical protein M5U21_00170 [Fimbriimonadaceae bacterium]|nr:hypothetical protein [Fimbriimonadaceae bacterium]